MLAEPEVRKVMVCGGRTFNDESIMFSVLDVLTNVFCMPEGMEIIEGGARGADALAGEYARSRGLSLTVVEADWDKHGKGAGFIRNSEMIDMADAVVAFWDGKSRGTKHSIDLAVANGLPLIVVRYYG